MDSSSETPLHRAARGGWLDICRLIIDMVDNKNPVKSKENGSPYPSCTPLHVAAEFGHIEVCQLIIDKVQDQSRLNLKDFLGETPLHKAIEKGNYEIFRLIFYHVKEKNPSDNSGVTPLHLRESLAFANRSSVGFKTRTPGG